MMAKILFVSKFSCQEAPMNTRTDSAQQHFFGTVLALVSWLIFAAAAWFVMPAYVRLSTTTPEVIEAGIIYGRIVSVFSIGIFLESIWTKILQAGGNMRVPMIAQICGALINVVLDPILIFGLGPIPATGIAGAAIATVIGQIGAAIITAARGFHRPPALRLFRQYIPTNLPGGLPLHHHAVPLHGVYCRSEHDPLRLL